MYEQYIVWTISFCKITDFKCDDSDDKDWILKSMAALTDAVLCANGFIQLANIWFYSNPP